MSAASSRETQSIARETSPASPAEYSAEAELRIKTLIDENAEYKRRAAIYRSPQEEFESLSMRKPQTTVQSYQMLGLLLGAFPPAAFFTRMGHYGLPTFHESGNIALFFLFIFMNFVCMLVGWNMGGVVGKQMGRLERSSWSTMIVSSILLALFWALVTGAAGGTIVFLIGGIAGIFFALPVALAAFPAFAIAHRFLERGHLIERKHLLPVAYGISLAISALILGYH